MLLAGVTLKFAATDVTFDVTVLRSRSTPTNVKVPFEGVAWAGILSVTTLPAVDNIVGGAAAKPSVAKTAMGWLGG
jgi:hypothetical protein